MSAEARLQFDSAFAAKAASADIAVAAQLRFVD